MRRDLLVLLAVGGALSGTGCTAETEAVATARLEISERDAFNLDGATVAREGLKQAVRAKRPEMGKLVLHVVASPKASVEAVDQAIQAAEFAGAQVGLVGNERF